MLTNWNVDRIYLFEHKAQWQGVMNCNKIRFPQRLETSWPADAASSF
jgi:hypothetical protein